MGWSNSIEAYDYPGVCGAAWNQMRNIYTDVRYILARNVDTPQAWGATAKLKVPGPAFHTYQWKSSTYNGTLVYSPLEAWTSAYSPMVPSAHMHWSRHWALHPYSTFTRFSYGCTGSATIKASDSLFFLHLCCFPILPVLVHVSAASNFVSITLLCTYLHWAEVKTWVASFIESSSRQGQGPWEKGVDATDKTQGGTEGCDENEAGTMQSGSECACLCARAGLAALWARLMWDGFGAGGRCRSGCVWASFRHEEGIGSRQCSSWVHRSKSQRRPGARPVS